MGSKQSAMKYIWDDDKLVGLVIVCPDATSPLPTQSEKELVRIFNEHSALRTANEELKRKLDFVSKEALHRLRYMQGYFHGDDEEANDLVNYSIREIEQALTD